MTIRQESIAKIKKAFENNELGYQKDASGARYYDKASNSCCAVGVLMDRSDKALFNANGNIEYPFVGGNDYGIAFAMGEIDMDELYGLTRWELGELQSKHDSCLSHNKSPNTLPRYVREFKDYLYSLQA